MTPGYDVRVVMTGHVVKFIAPLTLETLTKNKVYVDMFTEMRLFPQLVLAFIKSFRKIN